MPGRSRWREAELGRPFIGERRGGLRRQRHGGKDGLAELGTGSVMAAVGEWFGAADFVHACADALSRRQRGQGREIDTAAYRWPASLGSVAERTVGM